MAYTRVIPRDLFNEASLLKGLGKICLDIHDGKLPWLEFEHDGQAFNIEQNPSNGALYCTNLIFSAGETMLDFERPLNSRDAWPLYLETRDHAYPVFDDDGKVIITLGNVEGE